MSNDLFAYIREDLNILEESLRAAMDTSLPLIADVGMHMVNSGGKRLRPALCLLSARAGQSFNREHVMPLAVAIEMVHMASLMHDDVIDEADTRRGAPAVNSQWGNQIAILAGDHMFAQAFQVVYEEHYGEEVALRMAKLISGLSSGEIIQDASVFKGNCGVADYLNRIELKTADFLAVSCELGAMVSGVDEATVKALRTYGHDLGMAFQITDDLLDVVEKTETIGKPAGNDIRQGIVTLPVIRAIETSTDGNELEAIVTNPDMTDSLLKRALEIVRTSDGEAFCRQMAADYIANAKASVKGSVPDTLYSELVKIADFIGQRSF